MLRFDPPRGAAIGFDALAARCPVRDSRSRVEAIVAAAETVRAAERDRLAGAPPLEPAIRWRIDVLARRPRKA